MMRRFLDFRAFFARLAAIVLILSSVAVAPAEARTRQTPFPNPDVTMTILNLPSAPPGQAAQAPGVGVVTTPAILFTPTAGENVHGPAIVMLDRGPGSNPLRQGQSTRFLAERLAARGYTVLSLYSQLQRSYSLFPFSAVQPQIDAALVFMEERGYEDFVLAGNGYGAIAAADYLANNPDTPFDAPGTKRVMAVVMLSPLTELRRYPRAGLDGPDYEATAAYAARSVAAGTGRFPAGNTVEVGAVGVAADPWLAAGPYNGPSEQFTQYWGPEAAARNDAVLAALTVPTLVIGAGLDPTYSQTRLTGLVGDAPIQTVSYDQTGADFAGAEDRAADDVAAFLTQHALGVRPRIIETVIDVTADDGTSLPAVIYAPEGGSAADKPAILFVHGRTGDTVQSSGHWVGWRLAQLGYTVFTPSFRISGTAGFASSTMNEQADDMARWTDAIAAQGFTRLIAVGHSNGGIYISNYMARTHDPRVLGVAFMAPTVDERERTSRLDPNFEAKLAEARTAIDAGEGQTHMIALMSAQTFWDLNNPSTVGTHTARIAEYSVPTLSLVGRLDPLFTDSDFLDRFMAAQAPGKAELIWLENGTHGMRESRAVVVHSIDDWIKRTFGD
ncbi:alpha/beta fold hydrolase [Brevundimonas sp.]|uniref:alpha/beta hydrolase n=1 Tax=Brevundimonas sp. TaxID=1871086 RepID=UPI003D143682